MISHAAKWCRCSTTGSATGTGDHLGHALLEQDDVVLKDLEWSRIVLGVHRVLFLQVGAEGTALDDSHPQDFAQPVMPQTGAR
jgi:hypothetical protein